MGFALSCRAFSRADQAFLGYAVLVAEYDRRIVAGGLFVRDDSDVIYYLHGVQDRSFSHLFPSCAVIDEGIRWACESGATVVNLGMAHKNSSLDDFKSSWGAHPDVELDVRMD